MSVLDDEASVKRRDSLQRRLSSAGSGGGGGGAATPVDYLFKLVLVGNTGVGKTCLLTRWADGTFHERTRCTIGVDFRIRSLRVGGRRVKTQVWDSAGQERFRALAAGYYRGAHAVAVVFDLADRRSFDAVHDSWLDEVDRFAGPAARRVLVGNKADLVAERQVPEHEARQAAQALGVLYVETSARTDDRVGHLFDAIVHDIITHDSGARGDAADGDGDGDGEDDDDEDDDEDAAGRAKAKKKGAKQAGRRRRKPGAGQGRGGSARSGGDADDDVVVVGGKKGSVSHDQGKCCI